MTAKLHRRPEYRFSKQELGHLARLALRFVELGIAANPHHRNNRIDVRLAGRAVVLDGNGGLATYFHLIDGDEVSLDLVVDPHHLPDWFTMPTGTWFEDMDLSDQF